MDINAKLRTRLTGKSNPPSPSSNGRSSVLDARGARTPETSLGLSLADDFPEPASEVTKSPRNLRFSVSEVSESNAKSAIRSHDHTPNINVPPETSSDSGDRSRDSSIRHHRRAPPPPPLRHMAQSGNSSETSSQSSDSPRRSQSVRRPPPPPPRSPRQSITPCSPIITSFSPHRASSPDPAMIASLSGFAQQMGALASSVASDALSKQPPGRHRSRGGGSYVTKTNCVDISDSNVEGLTMNNGGANNSGSVLHKMAMPPPRLPRQQF
ncbi:hypothetical protein HD554DRAFT_1827133 [Boletus coccyginus]|nr:hypothetical protein HD554DRAFT_1827133 [Boletus coccyginus]